jgi:hypothetical protein
MRNHGAALRARSRASAFAKFALLVIASTLLPIGSAAALILGSLAPPNMGGCGNCNGFQAHTEPGQPSYQVPPGNWVITSWSAQGGGTADGMARLRVYRPGKVNGRYILVRESALELVKATDHLAFATHLRVRGGDLLGIYTASNLAAGWGSVSTVGANMLLPQCGITGVGQKFGPGTGCPFAGPLVDHLANIKVTLRKTIP